MDAAEYADLLKSSIVGDEEPRRGAAERTPSPSVCASIKREENLQFQFMAFYQVLVAILAVVALLLLILAGWLVSQGSASLNGVLAGTSAIVTGAGALFLSRQRKDARDMHEAAAKLWRESGCA